MTTQEKLARLHNRLTHYELAAIRGNERILIAYSVQRSRHAILECCRKHGQAVVALTCPSGEELLTWPKPASNGTMIGEWSIRFTGRTQRDAILEGELPWIGERQVAA